MTGEQIVSFTTDEAQALVDFLRKFEASTEALRLQGMVSMRRIDALSSSITEPKKAHPYIEAVWDLLRWFYVTPSFDGFLKSTEEYIDTLEFLGYVQQREGYPTHYKITDKGIRALQAHDQEKNS